MSPRCLLFSADLQTSARESLPPQSPAASLQRGVQISTNKKCEYTHICMQRGVGGVSLTSRFCHSAGTNTSHQKRSAGAVSALGKGRDLLVVRWQKKVTSFSVKYEILTACGLGKKSSQRTNSCRFKAVQLHYVQRKHLKLLHRQSPLQVYSISG